MHIIIGGAYQGKLTYAKEHLNLPEDEICDLRTSDPAANHLCYYHLEAYVLRALKENQDPFRILSMLSENSIIISDDISCGIVPMDPLLRTWRETTGRLLNTLCGKAEHITRIFCGIPLKLK